MNKKLTLTIVIIGCAFVIFVGVYFFILAPDKSAYTLNSDGESYTFKGTDSWKNKTAITAADLPASHEGKPVTHIASKAFRNFTNLTVIALPANLTHLGASVFEGCTALVSIIIPDSVVSIGQDAFSGCTNLASVKLPVNAQTPADPTAPKFDRIARQTFYNCTSLTRITLPWTVKQLDNYAFRDCTALIEVSLMYADYVILPSNAFTGFDPAKFEILVKYYLVAGYMVDSFFSDYFYALSEI